MPITPELEVVIHTAKTTLGQRDRSAIAALDRGGLDWHIDWQEVLRLAEWYQVGGFLASHLNKPDFPVETPREIRDAAYRLAEENRVRYLFFIEPELDRVLATLNRERIQVIALKGAALNRLVYRDLGLRPIGDVDLLIQEQHLSRARALFDELGYSQNTPSSDDLDKRDSYHYCPRLLSPDGSVEIELHRHLVRRSSPLYFEVDDLWSQAREKEIGGQRHVDPGPGRPDQPSLSEVLCRSGVAPAQLCGAEAASRYCRDPHLLCRGTGLACPGSTGAVSLACRTHFLRSLHSSQALGIEDRSGGARSASTC